MANLYKPKTDCNLMCEVRTALGVEQRDRSVTVRHQHQTRYETVERYLRDVTRVSRGMVISFELAVTALASDLTLLIMKSVVIELS